MPKNTVSDPITDQEMAFAHLVLAGTMNDRQSAEAVGLSPTGLPSDFSRPSASCKSRKPSSKTRYSGGVHLRDARFCDT
jgi:hypothetical protein